MTRVWRRRVAQVGVVIALMGAGMTSVRAQEAPPLLSPPGLIGTYVKVAETLELVSLQLRIEGLLGTDQAWLQRAWESAVARPDRTAVLTSLAQTAERLFSFVDARIGGDVRLAPVDRARARSPLADARMLYAYAHGADGDRTPAFERALEALALTNPPPPRIGLRTVPADVTLWLAGALDRSVAGAPASPATGGAGTGPGAAAPTPSAGMPPAPAGPPLAGSPPPPQGVQPTRPRDYVALPQPAPPPPGGFLGCYKDTVDRDLAGFTYADARMTVGTCLATCASKGFPYAAVQFGSHCFCGVSYGRYGSSTECTMPCSGAASETCGGYWANAVYRSGGAVPPPVDLGAWWSQQENGLHGIWVRRPGTSTFDAYWAENYVKSTLEIAIAGSEVRVRRFQGTDGYTCEYTGTLSGAEVNGTFSCDRAAGPMRWRAWIQGAAAAAPLPPVPPPANEGAVPSLIGTWSIACCNDALRGTMTITQQQGASFSGIMEGGLLSQSVVGRVQGDVVEFDRRTDEGPQRWSGRLMGSGAGLKIVGGVWSGAYEGRFTPDQRNWHAEKQR